MKQIKFSHEYPKLYNQRKATLLKVTIVSFYELNKSLIEYDTLYYEKRNIKSFLPKQMYYSLPKTNLLHLTFLGENLIPFCTIRRYTTQKYAYYKNSVGEDFEVVLTSTQVSPSEKSDNTRLKKERVLDNKK